MGGEKIEKVGEVIRKSYGHFLNDDSLLTAIYIRHVDREFDTEYHSAEELNLVDPRPKAGVIDISVARQKPLRRFKRKLMVLPGHKIWCLRKTLRALGINT